MIQFSLLLANGLANSGMSMTNCVDPPRGGGIEKFSSFLRGQPYALSGTDLEWFRRRFVLGKWVPAMGFIHLLEII